MISLTSVTRMLALPLVVLPLLSCVYGSGTPATETRELDRFDKIDIAGMYKLVVHVEPGVAQRVEVTADDNIVRRIETTVASGELEIGDLDDVKWLHSRTLKRVEVWVPALVAIETNGVIIVEVEGLHGQRFELRCSAMCDSTLRGAVERFNIVGSGKTDVDAKQLEASSVSVKLSGAGEVGVWARETLDVELSGTGKVTYWGDPRVNERISGEGELKRGE
jgi:hypothetical protein